MNVNAYYKFELFNNLGMKLFFFLNSYFKSRLINYLSTGLVLNSIKLNVFKSEGRDQTVKIKEHNLIKYYCAKLVQSILIKNSNNYTNRKHNTKTY